MLIFLSIFQPFQLRFYPDSDKLRVILVFTLITGLGLGFNLWCWPRQFPGWFSAEKWSLQRELIWIGVNLLVPAGVAFCFKISMGYYSFTPVRILTGLGATVALGIIPITMYELLKLVLVKPPIPVDARVSKSDQRMLHLTAQRGEESLHLSTGQILVISSDANYVDVLWQKSAAGELEQTRLRATLRHVETQLAPYSDFVRCHRAHIVNLQRMRHFCGNQQGGKLYIEGTGLSVPVSRRYVPIIQTAFDPSSP